MPTPTPLDDVAFLARSRHRVEVLRTLATAPLTRSELHDETGVSQPTLGRILGDFADRNWAERRADAYALTPWGDLVATAFDDLLGTVETVHRVGDVVQHLPTEEMDFTLRRFGSATVTTPRPGDVFRHVRRAEELITGSRRVYLLSDTIAPSSLEALRDRVTGHQDTGLLVETVITEEAIQRAYEDRNLTRMVREVIESGRAPVYTYDGPIPMTFGLADDVAILGPTDEYGIPSAIIESPDEVVRAWVWEQYVSYRDRSTELTVESLPN